jgi:hypothetical protein
VLRGVEGVVAQEAQRTMAGIQRCFMGCSVWKWCPMCGLLDGVRIERTHSIRRLPARVAWP